MTAPARLTPASVVRRRMDIRVRKYRGRLYIAIQDTALELDAAGENIFRRINGTSDLHEIGTALAHEFGVPVDDAVTGAQTFAARLLAHGALEVVA